jgi:hypothetical protein
VVETRFLLWKPGFSAAEQTRFSKHKQGLRRIIMRKTVFVGVVMTLALLGCNRDKKTPKGNEPDKAPPPAAGAPAAGTPSNDGSAPTVVPSAGAGGGVVLSAGGGGGGGAAQAVRKAAKRAATNNELHQIHLFIESASSASGQMPSPQETLAAIQKEAPKIAEAIREGVIVLLPAKSREEIWAYEAIALEQGGQVLTNNGIERMDAQTLRSRLGMR